MTMRRVVSLLALTLSTVFGCSGPAEGMADVGEVESPITSAGAWYHLDAANGVGAATLSVVNGYKVHCPDGSFARTCSVRALVLPASCNFECRDGLLGMQGETVLRGRFESDTFVVTDGLDTWSHGLGTSSVYRLTGAPSCASDPCPSTLSAQKLNIASSAVTVTSVDFSHANDTNYVLDPTRGDDQAASAAGLLVSGRIVAHVFRADRVWRLETPLPTCQPQLAARAHAYLGSASDIAQFRTIAAAERATASDGSAVAWLVRTAESPTAVTFTSGVNDLWVETFEVDKATCAVTTTGEH